jgi:alpha-N-arabinofuranosidase
MDQYSPSWMRAQKGPSGSFSSFTPGAGLRKRNGPRYLSPRFGALLGLTGIVLLFLFPALTGAQNQTQVSATVEIDASKVEGQISSGFYGQFMEFMYEDIKGGLYAELLRDRSFEDAPNAIGLPRYWERDPDDRNDDSALRFQWDDSVFYPRARNFESQSIEHSLRITIRENDGQRRGIRQGGIPLREGVPYHGYFWLKSRDFTGRVTAALEKDCTGGEAYDSQDLCIVPGDWRKYPFTLQPHKSDPLAKLVLQFYGRGRVWIDQVSLLPGDAIDGVRREVFARIKELRPAFVRWPGGNVAQDYHWMWGIGPRDERTTWVNLSWNNEPEPSDFGTDEYLQFCRNLGTEPTIVVNVEGRGATTDEAAAWVEYVNGPASSKYGALRAKDGHPAPYGVRLWELGNEIFGNWVRGHSDAETYAQNFNRYQAAMKAVDPGIKLIAVGDNDLQWDRTVLRNAGTNLDYLAIHHYYGISEMRGDLLNLMAHPLAYEAFYRRLKQMIRETVPGRDIKLVINEWNTFLPVPRQHSMESALYGARLMNVFERSSDIVAMTAVSDLVNGWPGGVIQASRHGVFVTPTYLAIKLYNDYLGSDRLATRVEGPSFDSPLEGKNVPYLDVVASRSADGKEIFIKVVNTDPARPIRTTFKLARTQVHPAGKLETLTADSLATANSFQTPDAVRVRSSQIKAGANFDVDLPAHSVSVITLGVSQ